MKLQDTCVLYAAVDRTAADSPTTISTTVSTGKRAAAYRAVNEHVSPQTNKVGIGSGSTVVYAVDALVAKAKQFNRSFLCVPTSYQAKLLITNNRPYLQLSDLEECPVLDVDFDGADEVDAELNCIKGGGACMLQEKVVASSAKQFIVIADSRKDSTELGQQWTKGIPIESLPFAVTTVRQKLSHLMPSSTPALRMAKAKAGPVVTDNGMFVIDWDVGRLEVGKVREMNEQVSLIPGVVETGLFVGMADVAYFGQEDGTVKVRTRNSDRQTRSEHVNNLHKAAGGGGVGAQSTATTRQGEQREDSKAEVRTREDGAQGLPEGK